MVVLDGAHHKMAYYPPSQSWSNYHFFVGFVFCPIQGRATFLTSTLIRQVTLMTLIGERVKEGD